MILIQFRYKNDHDTACACNSHLDVQPWRVCMCGRTLGGIMGLAQHAEKKVVIFKIVQVFPSNFSF